MAQHFAVTYGMKHFITSIAGASALLASAALSFAEISVVVDHNDNEHATAQFKFKTVRQPARGDVAGPGRFTIVDGERDRNGGDLDVLHDERVSTEEDQPDESFFFRAGTDGGRILVDLNTVIELKQINTYSWHPKDRGPQVYHLYASEGKADGFDARPKKGTDPEKCGWKLVAKVDTRPKQGELGGQYGVSISDPAGAIGKYRYLLFDIFRTENTDGFGNTFYSEIDLIDANAPTPASAVSEVAANQPAEKTFEAEGGKYQITINTTAAPDLTEWAEKELAPVALEWYPKIVKMLPSDGYEAPKQVTITFKANMGGTPAATSGGRIGCNIGWFRRNLKGEAKGSVVHEMVHVVQQYGRARRTNANATRSPGWLVEGIADYLRWFKYEPQSRGAEISRRGLANASYDRSYRVTANFLNWASDKYDTNLVASLNAAAREGRYEEGLWEKRTGHKLQDLGDEWKKALEAKLGTQASTANAAKINTLTETEKAAGWKLLFNGESLQGWHNFKREGIRPGWQLKDGSLACVDPHNAGDIVTTDQFEWFELQLDYNISPGGNSGIMFHVTEEGGAAWATGPEFQLEDNEKASDPVRCGWLYGLYQPPLDPKTGKTLDATKPAGEWNHIRLLISAEKCEHEINGVKYFDYVLGSDDFNSRVAKSKFAKMPLFAKPSKGAISLQGDHGQVAFRNIKIRPIQTAK